MMYQGYNLTAIIADGAHTEQQAKNIVDMIGAIKNSPPPVFDMETFCEYDVITSKDIDDPYDDEVEVISNKSRLRNFIKDELAKLNFMSDYIDLESPSSLAFAGLYANDINGPAVNHGACKTSCCAIGTAAYHGIGLPNKIDELFVPHTDDSFESGEATYAVESMETWEEYSEKVFGINSQSFLWRYLFSDEWASVDNSSEGAVKRLEFYINNSQRLKEIHRHFVILNCDGSSDIHSVCGSWAFENILKPDTDIYNMITEYGIPKQKTSKAQDSADS